MDFDLGYSFVLQEVLSEGVISDDLRTGAFQTCGEVADAMLLYVWMVLSLT